MVSRPRKESNHFTVMPLKYELSVGTTLTSPIEYSSLVPKPYEFSSNIATQVSKSLYLSKEIQCLLVTMEDILCNKAIYWIFPQVMNIGQPIFQNMVAYCAHLPIRKPKSEHKF